MSGGASSSGVSNPVGLDVRLRDRRRQVSHVRSSTLFRRGEGRHTEDSEPRPRQVAFGGSCFILCVEYPLGGRKPAALHGFRAGRGRQCNGQVPLPGYGFTGRGLSTRRQLLCGWLSGNDTNGPTR